MKTYTTMFDGHGAMVHARSEAARAEVAAGMAKDGARAVKVGAFQMRNRCDGVEGKNANLEKMIGAIDTASEQEVQMLAFPEMCLQGYFTPVAGNADEATVANRTLADVPSQSSYIDSLRAAAAKAQMVVAFGFAERADDSIYNAIGVIDADGEWLGVRRKAPLYPWGYETLSFAEPGMDERAIVFRTRYGTVGISNCFDGEFPESVRQMRLAGAEVLLWCNAACGNSSLGTSHRINHSGAHAQANRMWVVCCNCVAADSSGTSVIVSVTGEPLVVLPPDEEALAVTTIDLAKSATWEPWASRVDRRGYPRMS